MAYRSSNCATRHAVVYQVLAQCKHRKVSAAGHSRTLCAANAAARRTVNRQAAQQREPIVYHGPAEAHSPA